MEQTNKQTVTFNMFKIILLALYSKYVGVNNIDISFDCSDIRIVHNELQLDASVKFSL